MPRRFFLISIVALALAAVGCANGSSSSKHAHVNRQTAARQLKLSPGERVVRHGRLPIAYLISVPTTFRIDDVTTGQQIYEQAVARNTHLQVSETGIKINNASVFTGALNKGDVYEIVLIRKSR